MDFAPEDAREYLNGVVYPANKEELATTAESNSAPYDLVGTIQTRIGPSSSDRRKSWRN